MRSHAILVALAVTAMAVPAGAGAQQPSDLERCEQLNDLYERYVAKKGGGEGQPTPPMYVKGALDQCRRGNTTEGIRALEKALRANGFKV
jgi:hypothetical protein